MKKAWHVSNGAHYLGDISAQKDKLEVGIWSVEVDPKMNLYLNKHSDRFEFNFKIYGLESDFISKVEKTYKNTTGNLGMLLNGVKGTGKTITAEIIANRLRLPVIMVGANYMGLTSLLAQIQQDIIILVDEYDKVFKGKIDEDDYDYDNENRSGDTKGDTTLLGLMDGTLKNEFRKVFILTTNRTWLNDNMLNRPGRIRYVKHFGDLELEQIHEIIDDCLVNKEFKDSIIAYLKPLKIITVDIVKAVISEVNIFNQMAADCCKELNVESKEVEYHVYNIEKDGSETILDKEPNLPYLNALLQPINGWKSRYFYINNEPMFVVAPPNYTERIYKVNENSVAPVTDSKTKTIKIVKTLPTHKVFSAF